MEPEQLHRLISDLKEIMLKDGKITTEENNILNKVIKNTDDFKKAYELALADNVITTDEAVTLTVLWDKIYDESYKIAMQDNKLSNDEAEMIFKIFDVLKQYE